MSKSKKPKNGRRQTSLDAIRELIDLGARQDAVLRGLRDQYGSQIPEITGILTTVSRARDREYDRLRRLIVEYHRGLD